MTCNLPVTNGIASDESIPYHPSAIRFTNVDNLVKNQTYCQSMLQQHCCSRYCLQKRHNISKEEKHKVEKVRRVCKIGVGVEALQRGHGRERHQRRQQRGLAQPTLARDQLEGPEPEQQQQQPLKYKCRQQWSCRHCSSRSTHYEKYFISFFGKFRKSHVHMIYLIYIKWVH